MCCSIRHQIAEPCDASSYELSIGLSSPDTVILRAESYEKDEYPVEGWPTTIVATPFLIMG